MHSKESVKPWARDHKIFGILDFIMVGQRRKFLNFEVEGKTRTRPFWMLVYDSDGDHKGDCTIDVLKSSASWLWVGRVRSWFEAGVQCDTLSVFFWCVLSIWRLTKIRFFTDFSKINIHLSIFRLILSQIESNLIIEGIWMVAEFLVFLWPCKDWRQSNICWHWNGFI